MNLESKRLIYALYFPVMFLTLIWLIELAKYQFDLDFEAFGVYPRDYTKLYGVILQPLIHADFKHLWANTIPLFFLLWSLFYFYGEICFKVFSRIWLLAGLLTWVIGRPAHHIGASGLIYGIAFFIFFSGVIRRRRSLMALSAIIAFVYGGIVWNMLPVTELFIPEASWEGHLSGAISGALLAYWYRKEGPQREVVLLDDSEEDEIHGYDSEGAGEKEKDE